MTFQVNMKLQRQMILIDCEQYQQTITTKMGSSMNPPSKSSLRNPNSRFSARSLPRSSRKSVLLDQRNSLSSSKVHQKSQNNQNDYNQGTENTQIRNGELFIMSRHEEPQISVKDIDQMNAEKLRLGGEGDLKSPNFCSVAESGGEYGLGQWVSTSNNKNISPNDTHNHDITISFSKAKNQQNLFRDDIQVRKSSLRQILEYQDEEVNKESEAKVNQGKEIQGILALKSIYSESFKTPGQSTQNTPKKKKKNQSDHCQQLLIQSKNTSEKRELPLKSMKQSEKIESELSEHRESKITQEKLTPCFNDYDTDFPKIPKELQSSGSKNGLKLSKKMQQLKNKIANRATILKDKGDYSKYSLHNTSLRKFRNSCSLDKSSDSRKSSGLQRLKQKLCRTVLFEKQGLEAKPQEKMVKNITQEEKQKNKGLPKEQKLKMSKGKNDLKMIKVKSQEEFKSPVFASNNIKKEEKQVDSPKKPLKKQSRIQQHNVLSKEVENNNRTEKEAKLKQSNQKMEKSKDKKHTFTDMIKKDHHGNKSKKSQSQNEDENYIKFSQVVQSKCIVPVDENLFSSTHESNQIKASEDYQFFDIRETAKHKNSEINKEKEIKARKSQIARLKEVAEELNKKEAKLKSSVNSIRGRHSQNNSTQEQSLKNKTYCDKSQDYDRHPGNMTTLNYQDILENFQEYMLKENNQRPKERSSHYRLEKKKAKSLEHSKSISSNKKLIIF